MKGRNAVRHEQGMISMMVTLIMMLVISLIVLGFAQISRREQRVSLDRQLSTQAFLAAESGVNDARKAMQTSVASGNPIPDKPNCDQNGVSGPSNPFSSLIYDAIQKMYALDSGNNVGYTCLIVSTQLANIHQVIGSDGDAATIPIRPVGGAPINQLRIQWGIADETQSSSNAGCAAGAANMTFPKSGWSCDYGVLRMAIVPTAAGSLNRGALTANQRVYFLYPTKQGGAPINVNNSGATNGTVQQMKCDNTTCSVNITNLGGSSYALHLSSLYKTGTVDITASGPGGPVKLADAQALIDVTGKAQDVLRRIQVRMSLVSSNGVSGYALESGGGICKRFSTTPTTFTKDTSMLVNDPLNPMCGP